ncbi:glycosyltransferase family 1 protein [Corynebacterium felinum]|uniref:glycosyltransferase family 4 protein n=1 Tax=Corynebacterium felinum TaxID=131318 RepID=UPI0023FA0AFE|nr:glycosyltransferase family 1 protein [Corynebacterium felinum]MDF5820902.1 glycosyltransferase family 1 protein [Corynebacterium felinum]WJY93950.1 GDP-mannose-dependent alpha-mannosyltransferase [Corynebacterium felinum]
MRVAIVAESFLPTVNGVSRSVAQIAQHLRKGGHEAIIIAPGVREDQDEYFCGFAVVRLPMMRVPLINSFPVGVPTPALVHALDRFRPDIVHVASPFVVGAVGVWAAKRRNIPVIGVFQTDVAGFATRYHLSWLTRAAWAWTRRIHNACDRTLAPSYAAQHALTQHGICKVMRWGRGVDAELFHPSKSNATLHQRWSESGRKLVVGYVGRLAAEKGIHRLSTLNQHPNYQLVIVGDGPEHHRLQQQLPTAIFTGTLTGENLAAAYASFDIFIHPGEFETFCQTIQESQAAGTPVIAPHAGGPIDLITHGETGYLIDLEHFHTQLAHTLDMLSNHGQRKRIADAARAHVLQRSWENICAQLIDHYTDVCAEKQDVRIS